MIRKNYIAMVTIIAIVSQGSCIRLYGSYFEYSPTIDSFEYQPEKNSCSLIPTSTTPHTQSNMTKKAQQMAMVHGYRFLNSKLIDQFPTYLMPNTTKIPTQILKGDQVSQSVNNPLHSFMTQFMNDKKKQKQNFDKSHIDTDFLTDEDIVGFIQKMNHESTIFLSELSLFLENVSDKYDNFTNNKVSSKKTPSIKPYPNTPATLSREEAIIQLKDINEKIFDHNDNKPLSTYILEMKATIPYLDAHEDATMIESIDFLDKNQHRTTLWDLAFWIQYAKTIKVDKIHPTIKNSQVNKIPITTRIQTLKKKLDLTTETKK